MKNKKNKKQYVYLVRQTQESENYNEKTIYVCSTRARADKYAQELNKEYAQGVKLDKHNNFIEIEDMFGDVHYYDVESMAIDEDLA